jgi:non-ribosomal peptide synthetase component F
MMYNTLELPLLTEAERRQLLVEWNATQTTYPKEGSIPQLFERQVEYTPEAVALVFEGQELIYRELNERATNWLITCVSSV